MAVQMPVQVAEMSATNGTAVLDRVRQALAEAEANGQERPGRPTLVKLTGASDHQVRQALAKLATAGDQLASPGDASPPAGHQPPESPREIQVVEQLGASVDHGLASAGASMDDAGEPAPPATHQPHQTTQPAQRAPRPWPLLVIGLAAAVAVWSGWVGLAQMAGFGVIQLLPGIWDDLRLNTAVVLPISVEAYAAYALRVWLGTAARGTRAMRFARTSAIASLVIGAGAQIAYHLMSAAGYVRAPWPVVTLVAVVPVVVLGLASALAKLVTSDTRRSP